MRPFFVFQNQVGILRFWNASIFCVPRSSRTTEILKCVHFLCSTIKQDYWDFEMRPFFEFHDQVGLLGFWNASIFLCSNTRQKIQHNEDSPTAPSHCKKFSLTLSLVHLCRNWGRTCVLPYKSIFQLGYTVFCWVRCSKITLTLGVHFWRKLTSVLRQNFSTRLRGSLKNVFFLTLGNEPVPVAARSKA